MSSESPEKPESTDRGGTLVSLQRGVLGFLLAALGIVLSASGARTLDAGDTLVAIALLAGGVLAFVAVVALFVEGYREGSETG